MKINKFSKTIDYLVDHEDESPLPLHVIPNYMGINLSSVKSISWSKLADGQMLDLKIDFLPESRQ